MSEYEIEKGVPMPVGPHGKERKWDQYPWAKMEVGDSFFVPTPEAKDPVKAQSRLLGSLNNSGRAWRKKTGHENWRFLGRRVEGGVRVWRRTDGKPKGPQPAPEP